MNSRNTATGRSSSGFLECVSGPLVRSSYRAEQALARNNAGLDGPAPCAAGGADPSDGAGAADTAPRAGTVRIHLARDAALHRRARCRRRRDEIWLLEHPPVFTLGPEREPRASAYRRATSRCVQIDRGGQVTYHGPGQLVVYPLIDLRRRALGVRRLVVALENAVIDYAASLGLAASGSREAPGVYVGGRETREHRSAHSPRRELPRPGAQRVAGSRAVRTHQCVRLPGLGGDAACRSGPPACDVAAAAAGLVAAPCCGNWESPHSAINTNLQAVSSR